MYDATNKTLVTTADIVAGLHALGIQEGDLLQVHSSLSALGYVQGGAEAVVDALLQAVGASGTVMVPTFNHGTVAVFDPATSPSVSGAISEAFRHRPGAHRSVHPTHPYAAIGPLADSLTSEHLELLTFDRRSPLGKLADLGGWVLLLGVGMDRNTAAHIGEQLANVPCFADRELPCKIVGPDGSIQEAWSVIWRDGPCFIEWEPLENTMRERNMIRDGRIGTAAVHLMRAKDVIEVAFELTHTVCPRCTTRPIA